MNDAKKLLLNILEDRFRRFQDSYSLVTTDFLDMTQGSDVAPFVRSHAKEGVMLYGGYEDAERRMVVFVPDYLSIEMAAGKVQMDYKGMRDGTSQGGIVTCANSSTKALHEYFLANPDESPISILDVKIREKGATLRHGDYLGSLLALGIKREKTGDIMVREDGAQIFVATEIAQYLAENYYNAGRVSIEAKAKPLSELVVSAARTEQVRVSVASVRLDNMISAAFDVSRKAAVEAIGRGLVFVDNIETKKPDYFLKGGEKLVLRGKGKAIYRGESGTSKKGKIYVTFDKYV